MQKEEHTPALFEEPEKDLLSVERELNRLGYRCVVGVDEAGRGPMAGPVVCAAVVLGDKIDIAGIDDSKVLSESQRLRLYRRICDQAEACAVAVADHKRIDEINILQASLTTMVAAIDCLPVQPDYVLVDGNKKIPTTLRQRTIVGGDGKSASIAAASILAKVTRDLMMQAYHHVWPEYGFDGHKGYCVARHREIVAQLGPCPIHRRSFRGVKEYCP